MTRLSVDAHVSPSAYIFDLVGTLVPIPSAELARRSLRQCAAILNVEERSFAQAWRDTFVERNTGAWGGTEDYLTRLVSVLHCPADVDVQAIATLRRRFARETLGSLSSSARATLVGLRSRGHRIGLITVCGPAAADVWAELPYRRLTDHAQLSCRAGVMKPAVQCYTRVCGELGVHPCDSWYIGDGAGGELEGAREAGLTAVLLHSPTSLAAGLAPKGWTGRRIPSLDRLLTP